jgi:hypothetical protein
LAKTHLGGKSATKRYKASEIVSSDYCQVSSVHPKLLRYWIIDNPWDPNTLNLGCSGITANG